jgi:hypothetical protein
MAGHDRGRAQPRALFGAPMTVLIIAAVLALASGGQWSLSTWLRLLP